MSRIEELEKKLAADPNSRIFVQLAEEYRKQGLLENAIEICEQGLTKHPQYPSARVALGRALLEAETYDRAREEFEAVLAQIPDNILANKFLGETYHRLGRYEDAIQKYQIAQTLSPDDTEIEGKIEAVKAEEAAGGPPPPAPVDADGEEGAEPLPPLPGAPPPMPVAGGSAERDTPMGLSLGVPQSSDVAPEPLEQTLVDYRADAAAALGAAAPPPSPATPEATSEPEPEEAEEPAAPEENFAPIPIVDVDEPMVLEGSPYSNATSEPEPPPLERVPIVSSMEMLEMEPPAAVPDPASDPISDPLPEVSVEPEASSAPVGEPAPPPTPAQAVEPITELPASPPVEPVVSDPPLPAPPVPPVPMSPAAVEPAVAAPTESNDDDIETPTMAELYASQGHFDKAALVYRNLLVRDPNETKYLERIEELEMLANASAESATARPLGHVEPRSDTSSDVNTRETIAALEQWLDGIRRSRRA